MANQMLTCPDICPKDTDKGEHKVYKEAGSARDAVDVNRMPYTPGMIRPLKKTVYPKDAPPPYLPQSTDTTSGDTLGMGPIGPWAAGHPDWSPQTGVTGVRPVVDKYSITRYSTGQWRRNNEATLNPPWAGIKDLHHEVKECIDRTFDDLNKQRKITDKKMDDRLKDVTEWKKKAEQAVKNITKEIQNLDADRTKLKSACRILMLPEAIGKESLELRTHRYEPDMVRDNAEQELIKEVAIVGEIRKIFQDTLRQVEEQMVINKAAKAEMEFDCGNKMSVVENESKIVNLNDDSTLVLYHHGVTRWPENAVTLEYYNHFCKESIRNCEDIRQNSIDLRDRLKSIIKNGAQDMKTQVERTNLALAETVDATKQMLAQLEDKLKLNLALTADAEQLVTDTTRQLAEVLKKNKVIMSRLHMKHYFRHNVENCRDDSVYALMDEAKLVKKAAEDLQDKIREAEMARLNLMKGRGGLEKDIACKRKSLLIDEDRLSRVRAHMPPPEEFDIG